MFCWVNVSIYVSPEEVVLLVEEHKEATKQPTTRALRNLVRENVKDRILSYPWELMSGALWH